MKKIKYITAFCMMICIIMQLHTNVSANENNICYVAHRGYTKYAPENSISLYKMYSSYLTVVPKDQMPIDMEKLNDALLGERGYYGMLLKTEDTPSSVLRFNINAFKNNYNLADLSKMELVYYGIKVGICKETELTIDKEFDFQKKKAEVTAESILDGDTQSHNEELDVYDIVLAGVEA